MEMITVWVEPNPYSDRVQTTSGIGTDGLGQRLNAGTVKGCPCDRCPQQTHCKANELACRSFSAWVTRNEVRHPHDTEPSKRLFNQLFNAA